MAAYSSAKGLKVQQTSFFTAQCAELQAVIVACRDLSTEAINVYTGSACVAGLLRAIETAYIGHNDNGELSHLFCQLRSILQAGHHLYFWDTCPPTPVFRVLLLRATKMQTHWLLPLALQDMLTPVLLVLLSHRLFRVRHPVIKTQMPFANGSTFPENRPHKLLKPAKAVSNTSPFH
jgi:hypothetical protein